MNQELKVVEALEGVNNAIIDIINALKREKPSNPKTVVTYQNEEVIEYLIEGGLGMDSIPDKENAVKIEIGTAVTSIEDYAFNYCSSMMSVTIPNTVTGIGGSVFEGCSGLTSIVIPNSMTWIGDNAFYYCSSLSSVTIGSGVASIGVYAFSGCTNLSSITLRRTSAPDIQSNTFGDADANYTGRSTYSSGVNVLKVPQGATGYETTGTAWKDTLLDSTKCGFHIVYE